MNFGLNGFSPIASFRKFDANSQLAKNRLTGGGLIFSSLRFEFRKNNSQIRYWPYMDYHSNDNSQNISTQTLIHSESAGSTSARTYDVRFTCSIAVNSGARTNNYNAPSNMVITEIAG